MKDSQSGQPCNTRNLLLASGGLCGFTAIALGAYAEHVLRTTLAPESFASLLTALWYLLIHASVVVMLALHVSPSRRILYLAGWLFMAGMILFSGSVIAATLLELPDLKQLAPAGGILLMAGWLSLAIAGMRFSKNT